ncbi:hypothetical protein PV328_002123 [Microctonus aethiopoides]|uniref:Orn/DAP/Arg decarboxylase 2 N-terminal domain-containing protein n=1 Tax=Microctonus aethiopoides TaxID=144406 RepID=A0AA39FYV8_9HYME|nr:hypothetical protein PV328_002123 [Microctonus aethiopoides]
MTTFKIGNISVYDDNIIDMNIIKNIIQDNNQEDAFYILDVESIVRQHQKWCSAMPKVSPHYAIKCNPDQTVIEVLASLNSKFDCASKQEMQQLIQSGVSSDRIIYSHPAKPHSHIKYAKNIGVKTIMIDNTLEVLKLKEIYPDAKLVIRLSIDSGSYGIDMSKKFGCEITTEIITLMNFIKKEKMFLQGFSFHLGSPCLDSNAFNRGIEICKNLINTARDMGFDEVNLIDIGGGIPGNDDNLFYKIAKAVNKALENLDPSIEVISEPGRYYVDSAFTLVTYIQSKRIIVDGEIMKKCYYINDGIFGSFLDKFMAAPLRVPIPLCNNGGELFKSKIWGPTCHPDDCVIDDIMIQDLSIGDWIVWQNMGSYTLCTASSFNGFPPPAVYPIIRKTGLKTLINGINGVRKLKLIDNYGKEEILEKIKEKNPFITHEILKLIE